MAIKKTNSQRRLSSRRKNVFSTYQVLKFDHSIFRRCRNWFLLSDFAEQLHCKNEVKDFTLNEAAGLSPTLVLNQNAEPNRKKAGSLSRHEHQNLQRLYTQGGAAYESVQNLVKAGRLPASKVRQFLQSKPFSTKFNLAASKFKRMETICKFQNAIWSADPA